MGTNPRVSLHYTNTIYFLCVGLMFFVFFFYLSQKNSGNFIILFARQFRSFFFFTPCIAWCLLDFCSVLCVFRVVVRGG